MNNTANTVEQAYRQHTYSCLGIVLLLLFCSFGALAQQPHSSAAVQVITNDEAGNPVTAVQVQLKLKGAIVSTATTSRNGETEFTNLAPGTYEVMVTKEGFETLTQSEIEVTVRAQVEVRFMLVPKIEIKDSVNIQANEKLPIEQGASPSTEFQRTQIKDFANKPATVTDALPLIPGVVRSPDGQLMISGSGEHRSALLVNSADVTDPATGQFGVTVPVDSVETISVFKTPFLAQYGRFTAGVVAVETRRGGEKWDFEINDPLPEFRIFSGHLRGLRDATPRLIFNGPLIANRLYISEGIEYDLNKRNVRTLSFPVNETKSESVNSFTQLDYIMSPAHTLTGTFHLAPQHINFVNLEFFNPQQVTPSFSARDYTGTVIDRLTLGANLLESTLAIKRFSSHVWGQGDAEMTLTPTGTQGNFFSRQDRQASRVEWLETFSLHAVNLSGAHNLKFGLSLARTSNRGEFTAGPVNIEDEAGRRLKRIEFAANAPFSRHDFEAAFFGQDHWVLSPKLSVDLGARFERQGITETFRSAPRIGVAWTPFNHQQTVIRGGVGVFYDRVPLSVYAFDSYPEQVITTYGPNGEIIDEPRRFINVTERAVRRGFSFIHSGKGSGNFAPYSTTWNIEIEHPISRILRLRANYQRSSSSGLVIVTPKVVNGQDALALSGGGRSSYRQLELTARLSWQEGQQLFFSYVRSRTRGDVNEFNNYLGNFPFPIVRPNQFANLPGDLPNRFLAWGLVRLPLRMRIAPIVEYRNGFPYAVTDAAQNYVGTPNKVRFPNFFSFDARASKDFQIDPKHTLRFSVTGYNLTNHFNALSVHQNLADPQFGVFFGNRQRGFKLDFDVIF